MRTDGLLTTRRARVFMPLLTSAHLLGMKTELGMKPHPSDTGNMSDANTVIRDSQYYAVRMVSGTRRY